MIYKPFKDLQLSYLGMGNMRLPTTSERGPIDENKAREIVEYAYAHGVNYYDTAFRYHGGESETFVGKVLGQYPRDSWYLASKMPGHMMSYKNGKLEMVGYLEGESILSISEVFEEQLRKCNVDYFDFYLLHNLSETSYGLYTDKDLRVVEYLQEQKKAGRIRHLGFSAHGKAQTIENFLNWNDSFEFAQIQLNYMDWQLDGADETYKLLTDRGIPIIAMEPCRGGKLASLGTRANAMLKQARPDDSIASWAFRFLQSLPGVQVVLSGMTTMEQLVENIALFSNLDPTDAAQNALLSQVVETMAGLIPCTACRYCCDACPQGLDIPKIIDLYNAMDRDNPTPPTDSELCLQNCIACGACVSLCPQNIDIPSVMQNFADAIK